MSDVFLIRKFLKEREALLIHFSTPMATKIKTYPENLLNAISKTTNTLSFSTILASDNGPFSSCVPNSSGSVGIIVDIDKENSVLAVDAHDCGTVTNNETGELIYCGGNIPAEESCKISIDSRINDNEWVVRNYKVLGVFVFDPIFVRKMVSYEDVDGVVKTIISDVKISIHDVINEFNDQQIFTTYNGQFCKLEKSTNKLTPSLYDEILGSI